MTTQIKTRAIEDGAVTGALLVREHGPRATLSASG